MVFQMKEEFRFMQKMNHDNIIKMKKLYLDSEHARVFLVMEHLKGKEMFEYLKEINHYSEEEAKKLFRQLLNGIEYMHSHGIIHRD